MGRDAVPTPPVDPTELLEQGPWIARLARSLTNDVELARDIEQETWVTALRTSPRDAAHLKPWLGRVLQNLMHQRRRRDSNRRAREVRAAREERLPSASDTAERLEMQRRLVDALASLEEPLRTTIVARYFDGLSAVEIAEREGISASTVRGRLMRGIEALRARLDRSSGGRASWAVGFASLFADAQVPVAATAATGFTGWLIMSTTTRLVTVGAVLVLSSLGVWVAVRESAPDKHAADATAPRVVALERDKASAGDEPPLDPAAGVVERAVVSPSRTEEGSSSAAAVEPVTKLDVRFVDVTGRPIPDVRVESPRSANGIPITSDAEGRAVFEMTLDEGAQQFEFRAACAGFANASAKIPVRRGETKFLGDFVLEFGGSVAGLVLGPDGAPVAGAEIRFSKPEDFTRDGTLARRGPPGGLGSEVRSAADGSFRGDGLPARTLAVGASAPGMRWSMVEPVDVPARGITAGLVLKLEPLQREDVIAGIVLDPSGAPVANATVNHVCYKGGSSSSTNTSTDGAGRFEIRVNELWPHDLCAGDPDKKHPAVSLTGVQPGERDIVLQFAAVGTTRLTVTGKSGAPLERFSVEMKPRASGKLGDSLWSAACVEGQGDSVIVPLPAVEFLLVVTAPAHERVELGPFDPRATPRETSCALEPVDGLRGRVLAAGVPVAGADVLLRRPITKSQQVTVSGFPSRFDPSFDESTTTGADGTFLLTPRAAGTYVVLCRVEGYAMAESAALELVPGRASGPLEIALDAGGVIEGRVITAKGVDPAGIIVGANRHDVHPRTLRVGHDGRFRFERMTPGPWMVERVPAEFTGPNSWAISQGKKSKALPTNCTVVAGEVTSFDIDIAGNSAATIVGHVSVNGVAAKGFRLSVWPDGVNATEGTLPAGVVDERGDVRIVVDRPGKYEIHVNANSSLYLRIPITLVAGVNPWTYALETGSVRGRVLDPKARDATLIVELEIAGRSSPHVLAEIGADGAFQMPNVPVGRVQVRLQRGWGDEANVLAKKELQIVRGQEIELDLP